MKRNTHIDFNLTELLNAVMHKYDSAESVPEARRKEALFVWLSGAKRVAVYDGTAFKELLTQEDLENTQNLFQWKDDAELVVDSDIDISTLVPGLVLQNFTLELSHRVLVIGKTNATLNGLYVVTSTGGVRAEDMNSSADFTNSFIVIKNGDYAKKIFRCKTVSPVIGSDGIYFEEFSINIPAATESVSGSVMLATLIEATEGTDDTKAVTPAKLKAVTDIINVVINKLKPQTPQGLAGKTFTADYYEALAANTGSLDKCTKDTRPEVTLSGKFFDGDSGTLLAEIDSSQSGTKALSASDDSGVYGALVILTDSDAYAGEMGKEGFFKVLTAKISPTEDLTIGMHTFQLKHSVTGDSELYELFVDNPVAPSVEDITYSPTSTIKYVSGVPALDPSGEIKISFDIVNAVKKHYNATKMGVISAPLGNVNIPLPIAPPAENSDVSYVDLPIGVDLLGEGESFSVDITPLNAANESGVTATLQINSRTDSVSDETNRKTAGIGLYPSSGYGDTWDPTMSLKELSLSDELQMLRGFYQRPSGDYSTNIPAGPNYDEDMGTGYKYCIPLAVTLSSPVTGFSIKINNAENFGLDDFGDDSKLRVQVKIGGATGWLDANSPMSPENNPINDGDSCAVSSECTADVRRVSFGQNSYAGTLFVRIGLPYGSNKKFTGVQVYDLSNEQNN